jgi:hypothetical protein
LPERRIIKKFSKENIHQDKSLGSLEGSFFMLISNRRQINVSLLQSGHVIIMTVAKEGIVMLLSSLNSKMLSEKKNWILKKGEADALGAYWKILGKCQTSTVRTA